MVNVGVRFIEPVIECSATAKLCVRSKGTMMNLKLRRGDIYLFKGPCLLRINRGKFEAVGKVLESPDEVTIPKGKSIPVETLIDGEVALEFKEGAEREHLSQRTIPDSWDGLAEQLSRKGVRIILILGEIDTGKTFFSSYLANRLLTYGVKIGILDCDTGQSDIGPPGTIGLAVLGRQIVFPSEVKPTALYFTGSNSPAFHFLPTLVGLKRLVDRGLTLANILIIDTPGWVHGDKARALHRSEIEMLSPDVIILLQKKDELEHLVKNYPQEKIVRLPVGKGPLPRNHEERKGLREAMYKKYLKEASYIELELDEVQIDRAYFKTGKEIKLESIQYLWAERLSSREGILVVTEEPLSEEEVIIVKREAGVYNLRNILAGNEKNLLVGLLDSMGEVLGIGIIDRIDYKARRIKLFTPLKEKEKIRTIQFGSLRLTPEGTEAGFVEPNYF
ncbi:MAG: Clp1/GlmU family protein [bacterium]